MELLTVQETARTLKVSPITIRRYITSGQLQAVKVRRAVRIRREAVEGLLTPVVPKPSQPNETPKRPASVRKDQPTSDDDPLWNIVGMVQSDDGPRDVSRNKYKYLAEAYDHRGE